MDIFQPCAYGKNLSLCKCLHLWIFLPMCLCREFVSFVNVCSFWIFFPHVFMVCFVFITVFTVFLHEHQLSVLICMH